MSPLPVYPTAVKITTVYAVRALLHGMAVPPQGRGAFVRMSGVLKQIAVKLSKRCNILRVLSSGLRAAPGSSTTSRAPVKPWCDVIKRGLG